MDVQDLRIEITAIQLRNIAGEAVFGSLMSDPQVEDAIVIQLFDKWVSPLTCLGVSR